MFPGLALPVEAWVCRARTRRIRAWGFWGLGLRGFGVWGLGFAVRGLGLRVWGFGVWGLGFGVWGLGAAAARYRCHGPTGDA